MHVHLFNRFGIFYVSVTLSLVAKIHVQNHKITAKTNQSSCENIIAIIYRRKKFSLSIILPFDEDKPQLSVCMAC